MARSTMGTIITRLRNLIDDAGSATFTDDDDLQGYLDDHRTDVNYLMMTPRATIAPGGSVSYLEYHAGRQNWEGTITVVDGSYASLSPGTIDYRRGVLYFAANQDAPVYIIGQHFDLYAAAVDVLQEWLSKEKLAFDFDADGLDAKRSQKMKGIQALIDQYQSKIGMDGGAANLYAQMHRGDVNPNGW